MNESANGILDDEAGGVDVEAYISNVNISNSN